MRRIAVLVLEVFVGLFLLAAVLYSVPVIAGLIDDDMRVVFDRADQSLVTAMMILLALGTFVAGVQASSWRICAVGGVLFLVVPGLGWLDQSPLPLTAAVLVIIALGDLVWWVNQQVASAEA